jgi:hypothetical protein
VSDNGNAGVNNVINDVNLMGVALDLDGHRAGFYQGLRAVDCSGKSAAAGQERHVANDELVAAGDRFDVRLHERNICVDCRVKAVHGHGETIANENAVDGDSLMSCADQKSLQVTMEIFFP